ncbi:MAG TPA: FAD-dependent oxidoreductase [Salinivirgaceae bacterium]|nr:FAD-dependent oxidoreductase [Salinivirgaceae bacterium]
MLLNENHRSDIIVVGAGPTGIEAAWNLATLGYKVEIFEKENEIGGNIKKVFKIFPNFQPSLELIHQFNTKILHPNITPRFNESVTQIEKSGQNWQVITSKGNKYQSSALILCSGFKTFNPEYKEEYGYGIYNGVITSLEFEGMVKSNKIIGSNRTSPQKVAILNCVGSRDAKVGNHYCSRVCCINAVKFGIEIKELLPQTEVYIFYMDLRMTGQFYEELYRKSQEIYGVNYIRGKISEASQTIDNRIQIRAEDTLLHLPMKLTVDLLILMVGIESSESTSSLSKQLNIQGEYNFAQSRQSITDDNATLHEGLYLAGTCKRPFTLPEALSDARAAALMTHRYLSQRSIPMET